jgi:hypothetical protein
MLLALVLTPVTLAMVGWLVIERRRLLVRH